MANARLECNEAREDRAKIFELMELLRAKYATIVAEKTAQSKELIKVCRLVFQLLNNFAEKCPYALLIFFDLWSS